MESSSMNPAFFLYDAGKAQIGDIPYPTIEDPNDVVIRIAYVGVCGSDVHFWSHGGFRRKVDEAHPLVMGHEACGTIHEVGKAVSTLQVGDRVAIEPGFPCRRCTFCKAGTYNLCAKMKFAACPPDNHGALTRFFKMPEDFCFKLPDFIGLDEGVLVEPLAVAVHTARLAELKTGQSVVVFGAGTVGLMCAAVAKAMGARAVVSVDVNESRLEFAQRFASTGVYMPARGDTAEQTAENIIRANSLGVGADVVLEATGVESCIEAGIHVLRAGGTFIQAGLGKSKIQFPIVALSEKEIRMKGCFRYSSGDFELAMHLLESRKISVKELITGVVPFENATEAWDSTKRGEGIKNLIQGPRD